MPEQIANRMYAPEGTYTLYSERHSGLQYFSSSRATKLTYADLLMKEDGYHVVFNVQDYLYICNYSSTGKVRLLFHGICIFVFTLSHEHLSSATAYTHVPYPGQTGSLDARSLRSDPCCLLEGPLVVLQCQHATTSSPHQMVTMFWWGLVLEMVQPLAS